LHSSDVIVVKVIMADVLFRHSQFSAAADAVGLGNIVFQQDTTCAVTTIMYMLQMG